MSPQRPLHLRFFRSGTTLPAWVLLALEQQPGAKRPTTYAGGPANGSPLTSPPGFVPSASPTSGGASPAPPSLPDTAANAHATYAVAVVPAPLMRRLVNADAEVRFDRVHHLTCVRQRLHCRFCYTMRWQRRVRRGTVAVRVWIRQLFIRRLSSGTNPIVSWT